MPEGLLSKEFAWKRAWVPRLRYFLTEEFLFTAVRDERVEIAMRAGKPHTVNFFFSGKQADPVQVDHVCISIDMAYVHAHKYAVLDTAHILNWSDEPARAPDPCWVDVTSWDGKDPRVRERARRAEEAHQAMLQAAASPYTTQAHRMTTQHLRKVRFIGEKTP